MEEIINILLDVTLRTTTIKKQFIRPGIIVFLFFSKLSLPPPLLPFVLPFRLQFTHRPSSSSSMWRNSFPGWITTDYLSLHTYMHCTHTVLYISTQYVWVLTYKHTCKTNAISSFSPSECCPHSMSTVHIVGPCNIRHTTLWAMSFFNISSVYTYYTAHTTSCMWRERERRLDW